MILTGLCNKFETLNLPRVLLWALTRPWMKLYLFCLRRGRHTIFLWFKIILMYWGARHLPGPERHWPCTRQLRLRCDVFQLTTFMLCILPCSTYVVDMSGKLTVPDYGVTCNMQTPPHAAQYDISTLSNKIPQEGRTMNTLALYSSAKRQYRICSPDIVVPETEESSSSDSEDDVVPCTKLGTEHWSLLL